MKKIFEEKNLLLILSFFFIIFVFINFTHNHYQKYEININGLYSKFSPSEFKKNINEILVSEKTYETVLNKECEVTGNMHDRHKVRWIKFQFLKSIYQKTDEINPRLPYYVNIVLHSLLIFLSLIIADRTFNLKKKYVLFFLLYITFIFQGHLGEYSFSIFEMFFAFAALYASKKKNIILFSIICLMAVLNRESGFILLSFWLIFNKEFKKLFFSFITILIIFLITNFETINCIINPKFFIPLEKQEGQVNFSDLSSISLLSLVKLIIINFVIPFGIIFYNYTKNNISNIYFLIIVLIYLLTFLIATPLHHMAVKMIILPLIISSFYLPDTKSTS